MLASARSSSSWPLPSGAGDAHDLAGAAARGRPGRTRAGEARPRTAPPGASGSSGRRSGNSRSTRVPAISSTRAAASTSRVGHGRLEHPVAQHADAAAPPGRPPIAGGSRTGRRCPAPAASPTSRSTRSTPALSSAEVASSSSSTSGAAATARTISSSCRSPAGSSATGVSGRDRHVVVGRAAAPPRTRSPSISAAAPRACPRTGSAPP